MARRAEDACPLCGGREAEPVVTGYDRMHPRPGSWEYVRCAGCGLVRQDPLPAPEAIPGLYPEGYDPHVGRRRRREKWVNRLATRHYYGVESATRPSPLRPLFRLLSDRVMRDLRPPRGGNRLLDVGCGSGSLLERYRELGWRVTGVEQDPRAVAVARERGLEVHRGTVHDAPLEGPFDLVVLSHVIEHVLDPVGVLARCRALLADGGMVLVWTPNARAVGLALFGSCWFPLDAPRHLLLFDPATIRDAADRAGLAPRRVRTLSEPRMLCESRHYARSQGAELPADPEARRAVVERSRREKREYRGFRKLVRPLTAATATLGRGEVLEAELVARR